MSVSRLQHITKIGVEDMGDLADTLADPDALHAGVLTASAGNFAQGLAWNARRLGIPCHVVVPDQEIGLSFSEVATQAGYKTELSYDKEEDEFTAWCSKLMLPEHQALIDAQVELAEMALPFGGAIDGWGTEGNAAN